MTGRGLARGSGSPLTIFVLLTGQQRVPDTFLANTRTGHLIFNEDGRLAGPTDTDLGRHLVWVYTESLDEPRHRAVVDRSRCGRTERSWRRALNDLEVGHVILTGDIADVDQRRIHGS